MAAQAASPLYVRALESVEALMKIQQYGKALQICDEGAREFPSDVQFIRLKGGILERLGKPTEAEQQYAAALVKAPKDHLARKALALLCYREKRNEDALEHFNALTRDHPKDEDGWFYAAIVAERQNDLDGAAKIAADGLKHHPKSAGLLYAQALVLRRQKDYEKALAVLDSIREGADVSGQITASKYFEAGENYDRLARYDEAFEAFTKAQTIKRDYSKSQPEALASKQGFLAHFDFYKDQFEALAGALPETEDEDGERGPHFFVGFPRSGTTLLHRMMEAHPRIRVLEETPLVAQLNHAFRSQLKALGGKAEDFTPEMVEALRGQYRTQAAEILGGDKASHYVDKMPLNIIYIPLLRWLFPKARFIIGLRHPFDCCLSCVMQNFGANSAMANLTSLDDTASLYQGSMGLYQTYKEAAPAHFTEVRYEDIIDNPEPELRKVCDFLGLEWSADMLDYREKLDPSQIGTISFRQVVEPIYTRSQYRWKHYAQHLEPYRKDLESFINAYGYGEENA